MAQLDLYFDLQTKRLVSSEANGQPVLLPDLYREDWFTVSFRPLKRRRRVGNPIFERVTISGSALTISIGSADTPLAQAASWTASDSDTLLTGELNLQTAGINALVAANPTGAQTTLEVKLSSGGQPYKAQFPITIRAGIATSGALVPLVGDTALGVLEADRTYVRKEMRAGEGILWQSADEATFMIQYLHNDKSMRFEEVA